MDQGQQTNEQEINALIAQVQSERAQYVEYITDELRAFEANVAAHNKTLQVLESEIQAELDKALEELKA